MNSPMDYCMVSEITRFWYSSAREHDVDGNFCQNRGIVHDILLTKLR